MPALPERRAADCPCYVILNLIYSFQTRLEHKQHGFAAGLSQHPSGDTGSIPRSKSSLIELIEQLTVVSVSSLQLNLDLLCFWSCGIYIFL